MIALDFNRRTLVTVAVTVAGEGAGAEAGRPVKRLWGPPWRNNSGLGWAGSRSSGGKPLDPLYFEGKSDMG